MSVDHDLARRWVRGFEAAARRDKAELQQGGADPIWSVATALSMIAAAEASAAVAALAELRDRDDQAVRAIWSRLRAAAR